jgi:hypothetical protein
VRFADVQADIRIGAQKARETGQEEMSRLRAMHVDPHQTGRLDAGEPGFGIFEIGNQVHAALTISLSIQRRAYVARRALEQPGTQTRLEALDGVGHRAARQAEIIGCPSEAPALNDPGEDAHRVEPVHARSIVRTLG